MEMKEDITDNRSRTNYCICERDTNFMIIQSPKETTNVSSLAIMVNTYTGVHVSDLEFQI